MKKSTKRLLVICAILLLTAGWTWRYVSLNAFWKSTIPDEYTETVCSIGETVTFGEDIFLPDGYAMCVNQFATVDYDVYLEENQIVLDKEPSMPPDKLAIVNVTLSNVGEADKSISLLEFSLHGIDAYFSFSMELIAASNPILNGEVGVTLRPGESCDFILVYEIRDKYLSAYTWKNFESYDLYLRTTVYPHLQEIKVQ